MRRCCAMSEMRENLVLMSRRGLLLTHDRAARRGMEEEFIAWYDSEHLPEAPVDPRLSARRGAGSIAPGDGNTRHLRFSNRPRCSHPRVSRFLPEADAWTKRCPAAVSNT